jgi:REP element-mobilizing transposase RayT
LAVGRGFAQVVARLELRVLAAAILPNHVHLVVARHLLPPRSLAGLLKRGASRQLTAEGIHPLSGRTHRNGRPISPWGEHSWSVFLPTRAAVRRSILYVEENPIRAGLKRQRWSSSCHLRGEQRRVDAAANPCSQSLPGWFTIVWR